MKKFLFILIVCLAGTGTLSAQQNVVETRFSGKEITGIRAEGCWQIVVSRGERTCVTLTVDPDLQPYFSCNLEGKTVCLRMENVSFPKKLNIGRDNSPTAYIVLSELDYLHLEGACNFKTENVLTSEDCRINVEGACKIVKLPLRVNSLHFTQSGATDISGLSVTAQGDVRTDISGAAKLREVSVRTPGNLRIEVSGLASVSAEIDVDRLDLYVSSNGKVSIGGRVVRTDFHPSALSQIDVSALKRK